jgi:hypothetical protein
MNSGTQELDWTSTQHTYTPRCLAELKTNSVSTKEGEAVLSAGVALFDQACSLYPPGYDPKALNLVRDSAQGSMHFVS